MVRFDECGPHFPSLATLARDLWVAMKYLEDHPMTCKWLITMVIVFVPKTWGYGTPYKWPNFMAYK